MDLHGQPKEMILLMCPRCKRGIGLDPFEYKPPPGKPVPLCGQCLQDGERMVLQEYRYASGPVDLRL
jgi:hypothetical protein